MHVLATAILHFAILDNMASEHALKEKLVLMQLL